MAHRGKFKHFSDWIFVTKARHLEQMPLLTTWDGVRCILTCRNNSHSIEALADFYKELQEGRPLNFETGLFSHLHMRVPLLIEQLHDSAVKVSEPQAYCSCWWDTAGKIWWSYAAEDASFMKRTSNEGMNFGTIQREFYQYKEVNDVRFVEEAVPDRRRNSAWVEVFPSRI